MSDIVISPPVDQDELNQYVPVHRRTYLMTADDGREWADWVPTSNVRLARRGDRIIGGAVLVPMGQWFGARSVPMTGISAVGIEPAERASGAGTVLMKEILAELHRSGVAISTLYPATNTVYRRCGYELSGDHIRYKLGTDLIDVRDRRLKIELTTDRDAVKAVYDEYSKRTSGLVDRNDYMWGSRVFEVWKQDCDAYLVHGSAGEPEGYVVYYRTPGESVRGNLHATWIALTSAAVRRILTFFADHRSFLDDLRWTGAPADPFTFALSEPRRQVTMSWPWMTRIVDVERALTERGYPAGVQAEVQLRIADDQIPSNDGALTLRVADGKAQVDRGGEGRVSIDIRGLAPLYTGYTSAHELVNTGYIEGSNADLAALSAVFAGPAPWSADFF